MEKSGASDSLLYPVIFFELQGIHWAMGLEWIQEVLQTGGLGIVPNAHPVIAGLLNVRGDVLPVLKGGDILMDRAPDRAAPGSHTGRAGDQKRVVLIGANGLNMGLMVDSVLGIGSLDMGAADRQGPREGEDTFPWKTDFVWKVAADNNGAPVPLLDVPRLVDYVTGISRHATA